MTKTREISNASYVLLLKTWTQDNEWYNPQWEGIKCHLNRYPSHRNWRFWVSLTCSHPTCASYMRRKLSPSNYPINLMETLTASMDSPRNTETAGMRTAGLMQYQASIWSPMTSKIQILSTRICPHSTAVSVLRRSEPSRRPTLTTQQEQRNTDTWYTSAPWTHYQ